MATKTDKKNAIRQGIIDSAAIYSQNLAGKKVNDFFLPMSLRVKDSSIEKSNDGEIVDFIFSKDASVAKYDTLLVEDKHKFIPESIKQLISEEFYNIKTD